MFSGLGLSNFDALHMMCCRVLHCSWQRFLASGSENCSEPKLGLGFCCPVEERSFFPQPVWLGSGPSRQLSPCTAPPAGWVLTFLHGWCCSIPLPQCTAPLKGKSLPSATLFAWQCVWILQLTVLSSSGAGAWGLNAALCPSKLCQSERFRLLLCLELHNTTALATGCCVYRQWGVLIIGCSLPPALSTYWNKVD